MYLAGVGMPPPGYVAPTDGAMPAPAPAPAPIVYPTSSVPVWLQTTAILTNPTSETAQYASPAAQAAAAQDLAMLAARTAGGAAVVPFTPQILIAPASSPGPAIVPPVTPRSSSPGGAAPPGVIPAQVYDQSGPVATTTATVSSGAGAPGGEPATPEAAPAIATASLAPAFPWPVLVAAAVLVAVAAIGHKTRGRRHVSRTG